MKYKLHGIITVSCYCEVEADSEQEALSKAEQLQPTLGFMGSGALPDENWLIEDADGIPTEIRIEEAE